jgi:hypothetical protein
MGSADYVLLTAYMNDAGYVYSHRRGGLLRRASRQANKRIPRAATRGILLPRYGVQAPSVATPRS